MEKIIGNIGFSFIVIKKNIRNQIYKYMFILKNTERYLLN